ncbi:MAG: formate dehydrogenase accessory sulfurtransferase FdhD [Kangiellaceae bacterium]|nr:formate dehydrogenase accessory sulfurtransferase FdhD [Kangiellaceae bacterium]
MNEPVKGSITKVNRYQASVAGVELQNDPIGVEEPLQISLVQGDTTQVFSLTMRTPGNDEELVHGLLFSEGVIDSADQISGVTQVPIDSVLQENLLEVQIDSDVELNLSKISRRHASYSGCGLCGKTSLQALELKQSRAFKRRDFRLNLEIVKQLKGLLAEQPLFSQTGGVHVAGLVPVKNGEIAFDKAHFFEDVGRHNALDKLIGHELLENDLNQSGILLLSGRIGFELVQKAIMAGFSSIVALGAPSNLAIQAANQFDIALIGFAKDERFNLYTAHHELIG